MPLSAFERAKRYRKKNKDVVTNRDNLYRKVQRLTMKVMDPIKNAERLKNKELSKLHTVKGKKERKWKLLYHNYRPRIQQSLRNVPQRNLGMLHHLSSHCAVQGIGIELQSQGTFEKL